MTAVVLMLGGCGGGGEGGATGPSAPPVQAAPWATAVSTGDQLWQVSSEGLTLTAYAMGEDAAERDSFYSDDLTDELLVAAGDPIMFVNLVLTNTGDEVRHVATDQPKLLAAPAQSPYQQGVADITFASDTRWRDHDVWYHTVRLDSGASSPYPLAPGESCARGYFLPLGLGTEWGSSGRCGSTKVPTTQATPSPSSSRTTPSTDPGLPHPTIHRARHQDTGQAGRTGQRPTDRQ